MKEITLKLTGYYVTGTADITLWGGGDTCIEMEPFNVKTIKEIPDNINDSGFGVESINGAVCSIFRNYEGTHVYARTIIIGDVSELTLNAFYGDY